MMQTLMFDLHFLLFISFSILSENLANKLWYKVFWKIIDISYLQLVWRHKALRKNCWCHRSYGMVNFQGPKVCKIHLSAILSHNYVNSVYRDQLKCLQVRPLSKSPKIVSEWAFRCTVVSLPTSAVKDKPAPTFSPINQHNAKRNVYN